MHIKLNALNMYLFPYDFKKIIVFVAGGSGFYYNKKPSERDELSLSYEQMALDFNDKGFHVIGVEGRGQGLNCDIGKWSYENHLEDLHSVLKYLRENYPKAKICLFGRSAGSAIIAKWLCNYNTESLFNIVGSVLWGQSLIFSRNEMSINLAKYLSKRGINCVSNKLLQQQLGSYDIINSIAYIDSPVIIAGRKCDRIFDYDNWINEFNQIICTANLLPELI